jgi:capsular exopolysaccharide synthesis family protein
LAFLRQALDRRVASADDVRRTLDLPLLGYIRADTLGRVGMFSNGTGKEAGDDLDTFRILRANVDFLGGDEDLTTLAVTSPLAEEGKSTVSAGLAYANALAGRRTVLVECDLRRPTLAARLALETAPGLSDYLIGKAKLPDILRSVDVEGPAAESLAAIPAGVAVPQPIELLASNRFADFLAEVSKDHEFVVLDCAPLLPVGDALELLPRVDGVLLCIRLGQTTYEQARAAKAALGHLPGRPTGLAVTGLGRDSEDAYPGYYSARTHSQVAE